MFSPDVRGPRDVPALRDWMLREWAPGRAFAAAADMHVIKGRRAFGTLMGEGGNVVAWNLLSLRAAEMWWVDANMVDLLETAAPDLPDTVLADELPRPPGPVLCLFERPLQGVDAERGEGDPVRVDGILWAPATMSGWGRCLSMTLYGRHHYDDDEAGEGDLWLPLGRTDWLYGHSWDFDPDVVNETEHASMREDRRWLAALWALASEPRIATQSVHEADRAERRRAKRANYSPPDVRVVNLRGSVYAGAGAERVQTGKRDYHVRWPVKGHWRLQPYGPGRKLRRPTFIAPFIKGPEGAPLRKGATVTVKVLK